MTRCPFVLYARFGGRKMRGRMLSRRALHLGALPLLALVAGSIGRSAPAETAPLSLSELFKTGVVFQDRNGDGVVDFVDARVVLPSPPSAAETAAAADV